MFNTVLVDGREFVNNKNTGIARVLKGLVNALNSSKSLNKIILAVWDYKGVPKDLRVEEKIDIREIGSDFLRGEKELTNLSKDTNLFVSIYPKLPLFGCHCKAIHTIHDVLDITHPAYKRRIRAYIDILRLRKALKQADLTWYDSSWSKSETKALVGATGKRPKVRHLGIDARFTPEEFEEDNAIMERHGLNPGYVLVVGNGLPHKNPGILLEIGPELRRPLVFVGVDKNNRARWKKQCNCNGSAWLGQLPDQDMPAIVRKAFCLAQPSTAEGYGYPPLEAMACGVPAVVSDIPVLTETTGGQALKANPFKAMEWKEALESLEDETVYRRQVKKGLKWVEPLKGQKAWHRHIKDIEVLLEGN